MSQLKTFRVWLEAEVYAGIPRKPIGTRRERAKCYAKMHCSPQSTEKITIYEDCSGRIVGNQNDSSWHVTLFAEAKLKCRR